GGNMQNKLRAPFAAAFLAAALVAAPYAGIASANSTASPQNEPKTANLMKEVRHQLVLLPYYSVFDNLAYRIEGDKVVLEGQVVRPTLKSDAEAAVKSIEGVSGVVNNIEVLPLSPNDDQIRRAVYRSIYGEASLFRYGTSAVPS